MESSEARDIRKISMLREKTGSLPNIHIAATTESTIRALESAEVTSTTFVPMTQDTSPDVTPPGSTRSSLSSTIAAILPTNTSMGYEETDFESSLIASAVMSYRKRTAEAAVEGKRELCQSRDVHALSEVADTPLFQRVHITSDGVEITQEMMEVASLLQSALAFRRKYLYRDAEPYPYSTDSQCKAHPPEELPPKSRHCFRMVEGVFLVYENEEAALSASSSRPMWGVHSMRTFYQDLIQMMVITSYGPCKSYCFDRLELLEARFRLHQVLNEGKEMAIQKKVPHRDFYNLRKVDTHVHHSASMNQKHLLRFIKRKLRECPNEEVIIRDGQCLTLSEVFKSLNLTSYDISVDTLDVHAHKDTFHRFDRFNLKYNPCGQSRLREIFLKTSNFIQGRYLAELTKEVLKDLETSKYQHAEYRLSIYGRSADEFTKLARWVVNNKLQSDNVRWMIQIPRLYSVYRETEPDRTTCFADFISNIFKPLFEVSINPAADPILHKFLFQVVAFDCVDDESKPEGNKRKKYVAAEFWKKPSNPPYSYYLYYLYANLYSLNKLRESKGLRTFALRPHSGEAGDIDHLAAAFLVAENISHGVKLLKAPVLQYLYYLAHIGLSMSPLSNNSLFINYHQNPFPRFFARGLNVTLSTDDPLQFHITREPLIEEYSVAEQVWKLSPCDLSEIARNSVYQSSFEHLVKVHWLGPNYQKPGLAGNDITKTNVPSIRIAFREETLLGELQYLQQLLQHFEQQTVCIDHMIQEHSLSPDSP